MRSLLKNLFDTSRYTSAVEKERARMVYAIVSLLLTLSVILGLLIGNNITSSNHTFAIVFFVAASIACLVLTRIGRVGWGSILLIVMWSVSTGIPLANNGFYGAPAMLIVINIPLAGLLSGKRGLIVGLLITLGLVGAGFLRRTEIQQIPTPNNIGDLLLIVFVLTSTAGLAYLFMRYASLSRSEGEAAAIEDRLRIAEVNTQLSRRVARRVTLTELLNGLVEHICAEFPDIYHAQVFLTEPGGENARLAASTGEIGKELISRQHSLAVGSLSVIGQVTLQGTPIIARANAKDSVHRRNEFLPDTAIEAAFPLRIGNAIIGALDLQSKNPNAFPRPLIDTFLTLSDSIALAIDNVRQFERAEARIQENQQLVEQTRSALREVERLNERLTGRAWSEYLRGRSDQLGMDVDFETRAVSHDSQWTTGLREAIRSDQLVQEQQSDRQVIAMPLHIRGQVVGAMEFELDPDHTFTPEDLSLIQEIGERFGLAAENTRLVEESQRIAQREALVNEISSRLQATNNVETTLMEAARSLRDTLKAGRVAIRLGTPPEQNGA